MSLPVGTSEGFLPVGTIVGMIGINPNDPPADWFFCNGKKIERVKYPALYDLLPNQGTLPNLQGMALMGASYGDYNVPPEMPGGTPASSLGNSHGFNQNENGTYGAPSHTLTAEQTPSHQHHGFGEHFSDWPLGVLGNMNLMGSAGGTDRDNYYYGTTFWGGKSKWDDTTPSENSPFPLLQPSYALYFFIYAGPPGPATSTSAPTPTTPPAPRQ